MIEHVKQYKADTASSDDLLSHSSELFEESTVSLYRYGGFALHSLLKTRFLNSSVERDIILKLCIKKAEEQNKVPSPVQYLQEGGLQMVKSELLPFLKKLVRKVVFLVNDTMKQEYGRTMIDLSRKIRSGGKKWS